MNDLATLFGPDTDFDENSKPTKEPAEVSAELRALVGSPPLSAHLRSSGGSANLKALVGGSEPIGRDAVAADLKALLGERRDAAPSAAQLDLSLSPRSDGFTADEKGWRAPELAQVGKRPLFGGRRRAGAINYLSVAAAVVAVVALVGAVSLAVVQRATANPADDAMFSLREREAELANETKVLQTAADLYDDSVEEAAALAEVSAPIVAGLAGRVDGAALVPVENARAALAAATASSTAVRVPIYQRGQIDEKDLAQVGNAIDSVRLARDEIPALIASARDARSTVVSALAGYRTQLVSLGAAIESEATKLVAENDSAGSSFRTAVTDAAARVVASQQAGGDGLGDMPVYAAAVDALRAENARVVALEEAEREAARDRPTNPNGGNGSNRDPDSNSSDPGTPSPQPSQPAPSPDPEPSPEPSQPEPTPDPEPTEPSLPNPDPTAPIEGGTA